MNQLPGVVKILENVAEYNEIDPKKMDKDDIAINIVQIMVEMIKLSRLPQTREYHLELIHEGIPFRINATKLYESILQENLNTPEAQKRIMDLEHTA